MESKILDKIENAVKPDFGLILHKSFELFKKIWQDALYHVLITMALVIPFILALYIPVIMFVGFNGGFDPNSNFDKMEPPILWIVIYSLVVFIAIFVIQTFTFAIITHFFRVCKNVDLETSENIGGYFKYVKRPYFQKTFLLSFATFGISIVAVLLCYFPLFYVLVPLHLMQVIYAFNDELSVSEIIEASFKLGHKFWLIIFGLIIISSLIAQIGVVLCFVGIFFTAFFIHIPIYYLYKDTIGFE